MQRAPVTDRVTRLARALRSGGVEVSVAEEIDALQALQVVGLARRDAARAALRSALAKTPSARTAFDHLFDLYFAPGAPAGKVVEDAATEADARAEEDPQTLRQEIEDSLATGDAGAFAGLARRALDTFGRVGAGPETRYYRYPVEQALGLDEMLRRLVAAPPPDDSPTAAALQAIALQRSVRALRIELDREVERRAVLRSSAEEVARYSQRPQIQDIDLLVASPAEIAELRRAVHPLARKLAARASMRRRAGRSAYLDMRKTVHRSLSTGGAPIDLRFKHRPRHRPELFVLCDISSSVAAFARFSLMLVHALSWQFQRVRSFAFIEALDEVTRHFEHEDVIEAAARIGERARVTRFDGRTDYSASLLDFIERYGRDLSPVSTVMILGDARSNYRRARPELIDQIARSARDVWWLNPEPKAQWGSGDSLALDYAPHCDGMIEVRTLKQLEHFIDRVL